MELPPNDEVAALERELAQIDGQIGSPLSPEAQGSPGQQELIRRKREIEDGMVRLRRANDRALGEDLVDADLDTVADPPEPTS